MLAELDIRNFAIIKNLKLTFKDKMTALLGETGAGKSILIDAVSILLGRRAQSELIRTGESRATVTGLFLLDPKNRKRVLAICEDYGLPLDGDDLIIARQLTSKGRNFIRINGQLTTISALRHLRPYLVDVHGQSDSETLLEPDRQIDLVDHLAPKEFQELLKQYQAKYHDYREVARQLADLQKNAAEAAQRQDILQFQAKELKDVNLTDEHEDEELTDEFNKLANYQKIADKLRYLLQLFDDGEHGLTSLLGDAQDAANDLADFGSDFRDAAKSLEDGSYALSDARNELGDIADGLDFDQARYQEVTARLDQLNTLKKKYGPSLANVFAFKQKVDQQLSALDTGSFDEDKLKKQLAQLKDELQKLAAELHDQRSAVAQKLEAAIKEQLADLYMAKARFAIRFSQLAEFTSKGREQLRFYIAPNPGEELMSLDKIASGGERSRLVLALKAIFAQAEPVGTMVFDEIDTGVSGRVSAAIGKKMQAVAKTKQVIVITHVPQVAACADHRKQIVKKVAAGQTFTEVHDLTVKESVTAIAQMMAGSKLTAAAKQNAADLLQASKR